MISRKTGEFFWASIVFWSVVAGLLIAAFNYPDELRNLVGPFVAKHFPAILIGAIWIGAAVWVFWLRQTKKPQD